MIHFQPASCIVHSYTITHTHSHDQKYMHIVMEPSRILIIGATGNVGKHIAKASLAIGHPTFLLLRQQPVFNNPSRQNLVNLFQNSGAVLLHGSLEDYGSLLEAVKRVDVVISAVGHHGFSHSGTQLADQARIIEAIQEAGTVKRFFPSEFGVDVDRDLNTLLKSALIDKVHIRRSIEKAGIPYTFVSANNLFGYFLDDTLSKTVQTNSRPKTSFTICGDGNTKAVYVSEDDVGVYTIKAVDDPRTLNKIMYIRPPANVLTQKELVELWEQKTGQIVDKTYVSHEEIRRQMEDLPYPENLFPAFEEAIFLQGVEMLEIEPQTAVEATELFRDVVSYRSVDEHLNSLKLELLKPAGQEIVLCEGSNSETR